MSSTPILRHYKKAVREAIEGRQCHYSSDLDPSDTYIYSDDADLENHCRCCAFWGLTGPKRNFVSRRACSGSECENKKVIRSYRTRPWFCARKNREDRGYLALTSEHGQVRAVAKGVSTNNEVRSTPRALLCRRYSAFPSRQPRHDHSS